MDTPLYLALPGLHAEFLPPLEGCRSLWPGLPGKPDSAWSPDLPWPPAAAAACLADYERACRDGASGSPVLTLGAEPAPADLSDAERKALREMAGLPTEEPEQPLRQNAQQVLLLAWLQEKQALEMAALEQKISDSRRALAGLFSGATRGRSAASAPDERDLPDWKRTLAAALAFAPDMPEGTTLVVASSAMADAVSELRAPDVPDAPAGYRAVRASVDQLAALCGRAPHDKLSRSLSADQRQRTFTLFLPESSR